MKRDKRYLTAKEAAGALGIKMATLYAYTSRGMLHSDNVPGQPRVRRYLREEVERLAERKLLRRNPEVLGTKTLVRGIPILESAITLIEEGRLYYRGRDAIKLAEESSVEEVAALLWTGDCNRASELFSETRIEPGLMKLIERSASEHPIVRCQIILPRAGEGDAAAYDLKPGSVALRGALILYLLASAIAGGRPSTKIADTLHRAWAARRPGAADAIRSALILCADHELNVSAFTARCVASAASTPYNVVVAGLAALKGRRHGGYTERVEALLNEMGTPRAAETTVASRLRRGEEIPGFGHPLYPDGDPRAKMLLSIAEAHGQRSAVRAATALSDSVFLATGERPTLDFGLVTLARAFQLPEGAALSLFALGRTIGWIAHAIEQYASNQLIRPRAQYVGPKPGAAHG
jgi:citrate synthase